MVSNRSDFLVDGAGGNDRLIHRGKVNQLTIEPMRRRHLRRVLEIEERVYPRPWTHRVFVSEIDAARKGLRYYMVAYVGDDLVGYAGLMFSGDDAHITNIVTDPAWQGRGVASHMMLDLCHIAREQGMTAMTLEVRHTNGAAQEMYRKFGFVPAGVRRKYYENTDDAIIMWCNDIQEDEFLQRLHSLTKESR